MDRLNLVTMLIEERRQKIQEIKLSLRMYELAKFSYEQGEISILPKQPEVFPPSPLATDALKKERDSILKGEGCS